MGWGQSLRCNLTDYPNADLVDAKLLCKLQLLGLPVLPGPIIVNLLRV